MYTNISAYKLFISMLETAKTRGYTIDEILVALHELLDEELANDETKD